MAYGHYYWTTWKKITALFLFFETKLNVLFTAAAATTTTTTTTTTTNNNNNNNNNNNSISKDSACGALQRKHYPYIFAVSKVSHNL